MVSTQRIAVASTRSSLRSRTRNLGYVCLNCQLRALSTSQHSRVPSRSCNTTLSQSRQYASQRPDDDGFKGSFADKLRKKMWGTDNPPGQRNPYVRESPEEQEDRLRAEEEREARETEEADFARIREGGKDDNVIVGKQDVVEDIVDDVAKEEGKEQAKEYEPATTWRGLRYIPGWEVAQQKPRPWFEGFLAPQKVQTTDGIERAIQRALVEVLTMKKELGTTTLPAKIGNPTDNFEERLATGVTFDSDMSLLFNEQTLQEDIVRSLGLRHDEGTNAEEDEEKFDRVSEDLIKGRRLGKKPPRQADMETADSESQIEDEAIEDPATGAVEEVIAISEPDMVIEDIGKPLPPVDQSYHQVAFKDSDVKFAVLKRVMQLTGTRIPDPVIPRLNTATSLLNFLVKLPPAKHLFDDLRENKELQSLPNLQIFRERVTMQDKESEIGRWKLIEAELTKRGVPNESEIMMMEKEIGKVDHHVLPLVRQKEKDLRRRR